jgi:hypothetical protein
MVALRPGFAARGEVMNHVAIALTATILLLAVGPAHAFGRIGGAAGGGPVVVAPQQTFQLSNHQAVIVPRPFASPQGGFFIPAGIAGPAGFVPFRAFHRHFGHVIAFAHPVTFVVSPVGFWWWNGTGWAWIAQPIVW